MFIWCITMNFICIVSLKRKGGYSVLFWFVLQHLLYVITSTVMAHSKFITKKKQKKSFFVSYFYFDKIFKQFFLMTIQFDWYFLRIRFWVDWIRFLFFVFVLVCAERFRKDFAKIRERFFVLFHFIFMDWMLFSFHFSLVHSSAQFSSVISKMNLSNRWLSVCILCYFSPFFTEIDRKNICTKFFSFKML